MDIDKATKKETINKEIRGLMDEGFNCGEATVFAFASLFGKDTELTRMVTPFGAGIGGRRDLCGFLTAGVVVIGMLHGRTDPSDTDRKLLVYKMAADYYRWFKQEKKIHCSEIVRGKFTGHTDDCLALADEAQGKLLEIVSRETK